MLLFTYVDSVFCILALRFVDRLQRIPIKGAYVLVLWLRWDVGHDIHVRSCRTLINLSPSFNLSVS